MLLKVYYVTEIWNYFDYVTKICVKFDYVTFNLTKLV
jgi:hypothetical protein